MYITIKSIKKTLGKFIEMSDLYIGLPMLMIFLVLFAFTNLKIQALMFLSVCAFLLIPIEAPVDLKSDTSIPHPANIFIMSR